MDSLTIFARILMNYTVLYLTFRIIGKREVKDLNIFDAVIYMMIIGIATLSLFHLDTPYYLSLFAIICLIIFQRGLTYLWFKYKDIEGKTIKEVVVIIASGKLNYLAMRKYNVTLEELLQGMRKMGIRSLSEVDVAILEKDRSLSFFPIQKDTSFVSPLPLVIGGELMKENFKYVEIDEIEFMSLLHDQGYDRVSDILYANYENEELYILAFNRTEQEKTS